MYLERGIVDRSVFGGCGGGVHGEGDLDCKGGLGSAGFRRAAALELYEATLAIASYL